MGHTLLVGNIESVNESGVYYVDAGKGSTGLPTNSAYGVMFIMNTKDGVNRYSSIVFYYDSAGKLFCKSRYDGNWSQWAAIALS